MRNGTLLTALSLAVLTFAGCDSLINTQSIAVTATAYNSDPNQTDDTPYTPACGGDLRDGQPAIAVSRDLYSAGLRCGLTVSVNGKNYVIRDTMNARFKRRIDIYHGTDKRAALAFGKRTVQLAWRG